MSVYTRPDSGVACCAPVWMPTQRQLFILDGVQTFILANLGEGNGEREGEGEGERGREGGREGGGVQERERKEEREFELCSVEVMSCAA